MNCRVCKCSLDSCCRNYVCCTCAKKEENRIKRGLQSQKVTGCKYCQNPRCGCHNTHQCKEL